MRTSEFPSAMAAKKASRKQLEYYNKMMGKTQGETMDNDLEFYFKHIKTEADFWQLRATGLMYEFFPQAPTSWEGHLIMLAQREAGGRLD